MTGLKKCVLTVEAIQENIICRYNKKGGNEQNFYINKEASKSQTRILGGILVIKKISECFKI